MRMTPAELGVLLLVFFGLFHYLRIFVKTRAVLALLGAVSVGLTGTVGRLAGSVTTWAEHLVGTATAWAFGTAVNIALFAVLAFLLVHDIHPKRPGKARAGWIALIVGVMLVAGISQFPALAGVANGIRSLLAGLTGWINTL